MIEEIIISETFGHCYLTGSEKTYNTTTEALTDLARTYWIHIVRGLSEDRTQVIATHWEDVPFMQYTPKDVRKIANDMGVSMSDHELRSLCGRLTGECGEGLTILDLKDIIRRNHMEEHNASSI